MDDKDMPQDATESGTNRPEYLMKLYIAGEEANAVIAKKNLDHICKTCLAGNYRVQIIDVLEDFTIAVKDKIFVTPMLVVENPFSLRIYGNLSDTGELLRALRISGGTHDER